MGVMTNPLMALMRKRAGGDAPPDPNALAGTYPDATQVDVGLQDPQMLPSAPEQTSNGLNFQPDTDVLGPRLNPVKGLMQKLGFALGDAVRKQFGMPTDEELAQQDFENRLKVKQYKMQEQAAVSQEEMRKQQIEESRQEHQLINVPGFGNVTMKDMPDVMHRLAQEKQADLEYRRKQAEDKARDERAAEHDRTMTQIADERNKTMLDAIRERAGLKINFPTPNYQLQQVGDKAVLLNTKTGEVMDAPTGLMTRQQAKTVNDARVAVEDSQSRFNKMQEDYAQIQKNPKNAGSYDMDLLSNHIAMTFGAVKGARTGRDLIMHHVNARSLPEDLNVLAQHVINGGQLSDSQRQNFLHLGQTTLNEARRKHSELKGGTDTGPPADVEMERGPDGKLRIKRRG